MVDAQPRPIEWLGDSLERVRDFPVEVRKDVGSALYDVQMGVTPPAARHFKGVGSGVYEIVTRFDTNTYSTVYAVKIGSRVYVLHAVQKKAPKGIKTAKHDVNLTKRRYKEALEKEKQK